MKNYKDAAEFRKNLLATNLFNRLSIPNSSWWDLNFWWDLNLKGSNYILSFDQPALYSWREVNDIKLYGCSDERTLSFFPSIHEKSHNFSPELQQAILFHLDLFKAL